LDGASAKDQPTRQLCDPPFVSIWLDRDHLMACTHKCASDLSIAGADINHRRTRGKQRGQCSRNHFRKVARRTELLHLLKNVKTYAPVMLNPLSSKPTRRKMSAVDDHISSVKTQH